MTLPPLTAAQRGSLARLRVNHPRAVVSVPDQRNQRHRPMIRVRLGWSNGRRRIVFLQPDGRLEITTHISVRRANGSYR